MVISDKKSEYSVTAAKDGVKETPVFRFGRVRQQVYTVGTYTKVYTAGIYTLTMQPGIEFCLNRQFLQTNPGQKYLLQSGDVLDARIVYRYRIFYRYIWRIFL